MATRRYRGRRSSRRMGMSHEYQTDLELSHMRVAPAIQKFRPSLVLAVMMLALLVYGIYAAFTSDVFFVYESNVVIKGNIVVPAAEIFAASELDGISIFWVNSDVVEEHLESMPNIKSAAVKVRLPARVVISVEERLPALTWRTGDTTWWVDAEGTIIESRRDLPDALAVIDTDSRPKQPGEQLDPSTLSAIRALHVLLPELSQMRYSQDSGIGFLTTEGWPVYLGSDDENMEAKLTVLVALRRQLIAQSVTPEFINLEHVESPYYR